MITSTSDVSIQKRNKVRIDTVSVFLLILIHMVRATNPIYVPGLFVSITKSADVSFRMNDATALEELHIDGRRQNMASHDEYLILSNLKQYFVWETAPIGNEFHRLQLFIVKPSNAPGVCAGTLLKMRVNPKKNTQKVISKIPIQFEHRTAE